MADRELEIVWVKSAKVSAWRYGMVGKVRAFILDVVQRPMELRHLLPGPQGVRLVEHVRDERAADQRARELFAEFIDQLGQKPASPQASMPPSGEEIRP